MVDDAFDDISSLLRSGQGPSSLADQVRAHERALAILWEREKNARAWQGEVKAANALFDQRLDDIADSVRDLRQDVSPVIAAYDGQRQDSGEFRRAVRIAVYTAVISVVGFSIVGPLIVHFFFA